MFSCGYKKTIKEFKMKKSKPCILVCDDEPQIRKMINVTLNACDFKIIEAESGNEALRLAGSCKPDAIIMDLGLPDIDGTQVIKQLRQWSDTPIVVLSARSDSEDVVQAFDLGADDYITKPFDMNIMIARLNAAIKHTYKKEMGQSNLEVGDIKIDLARHEVKVRGELAELSPKEYDLLSFLMRNQGKMLTHTQILKEVWGDAHAYDKQYLRVYIMQVRGKIEKSPENPEYIITEAGIGYRFDDPEKASSAEVA